MAKKVSAAEQKRRREQASFARQIRTVFKNAGFVHLPTNGIERKFGNKTGELDHVFLFENVILVCEDTLDKDPRDHLKNKKLLFDEIANNLGDFLQWLRTEFRDQLADVDEYDTARYRVFFLYFTKADLVLTDDDVALFAPVRVVAPSTLSYFAKMAQNIKRSSRTDIFRFLGVKSSEIGAPDSGSGARTIPTSIIYPTDNTGLRNGVRIVSFMMSAEMLLRNSYVLRKDNWEDSIELYQRLIERERINGVRRYLAEKQSTFINNIIVSLPPGVEFKDAKGGAVALKDVSNFDGYQMLIPDEMNSICIIDGQHRIFAHYEGADSHEPQIAKLRKRFHLLVTGLIFPDDMSELERRKVESELFLDINSNARPVPQDVLLSIETLKDPFSDIGIARQVLRRLNELDPFRSRFQFSLTDQGKVKIASIIKFALRYLVDISNDPERPSLFTTWSTQEDRDALERDRLEKKDAERLDAYVKYSAGVLAQYFSALRASNKSDWTDVDSRLLSTTAINGFILALRRSLPTYGVLGFDDYRTRLSKVSVDYAKTNFPYTSSQYAKFSRQILSEAFEITVK